jgi:ribosomal protein S18 acetylase RimI-like enzyme
MVSCKDVFKNYSENDLQGCYIMTLGVIDECRKFGLGTALLNETFRHVFDKYTECQIIYLHVVDYNHSAINFYLDKNNFIECKRETDHYTIFDKDYDALLLYVLLDRE